MKRKLSAGKTKIAKIPWSRIQPPGFTWLGRIYLRDSLWEDYQSGTPSAKTASIIRHEQTHIDRGLIKILGFKRNWLLLSRK